VLAAKPWLQHTQGATDFGIHAEADRQQLIIEVWDNGPGIPAGQEQAIFDKFARGNKTLITCPRLTLPVLGAILAAV
jgi:K+-sensing histidine kinase KdpD